MATAGRSGDDGDPGKRGGKLPSTGEDDLLRRRSKKNVKNSRRSSYRDILLGRAKGYGDDSDSSSEGDEKAGPSTSNVDKENSRQEDANSEGDEKAGPSTSNVDEENSKQEDDNSGKTEDPEDMQETMAYIKSMSLWGSSLPDEWEKGESSRRRSDSQQEDNASLFMFEDGIVPLPPEIAEDDSKKKELKERVNAYTNYVLYAPRYSKRLPIFKDLAP